MGILEFFKPKDSKSASVAKERLQLILAHDGGAKPDYLPLLKADIIKVVTKHLNLPFEEVESMISMEFECQDNNTSLLELNIELPES